MTMNNEDSSKSDPKEKNPEPSGSNVAVYSKEQPLEADDKRSVAARETRMSGIGSRLEATVLGGGPRAPTAQKMERASGTGYDPLRIPLSVFEESRSTTPTEWSAGSNDSLFSINVGTYSSIFPTDRPALLSDLPEFEEPVQTPGSQGKADDAVKVVVEDETSAGTAVGEAVGQSPSQRQSGQDPNRTSNNSSIHSGISSQLSFTFPVLEEGVKGESVRPESDRSSPMKKKNNPFTRAICQTSKYNIVNQCLSCASSWRCCFFSRH